MTVKAGPIPNMWMFGGRKVGSERDNNLALSISPKRRRQIFSDTRMRPGVFCLWLTEANTNCRNSAGTYKVNCAKLNIHRDHKGKIENIQTSIDIPFTCDCSFSLQPAE
jgi:hypothetical protein